MLVTTKVNFYTIDEHHAGQRLDNYLFFCYKGVPKSKIYQIIRTGQVRINKKRAEAAQRLQLSDMVRVPPLRTETARLSDEQGLSKGRQELLEQAILSEDESYLILNKPRDFAVHGGSNIAQGLIEQYRILRPDVHFLQLCHRLDRETTGCLVLAKQRLALLAFQQQLVSRQMDKHYLVLVHGLWPKQVQSITAPLVRIGGKTGEGKVTVDSQGKTAITHILSSCSAGKVSLLRVALVTGRTHQIRTHCQYQGYPVVGDLKYGDRKRDQGLEVGKHVPLGLHAYQMTFTVLGKTYQIVAPPDSTWERLMSQLGFDTLD